jgi:hypothetical protein
MKQNMGSADKAIRIIVALVIAALYFTHTISGLVATIGLVFAIVFIATSFISWCPAYIPFGISTKKGEER